MPTFLAGLILGALSGGVTWALTSDGQLGAIVGALVALACWLGVALIVFIDD